MYTLQYRRVTPKKGTPKEVQTLRHLNEHELRAELSLRLPESMWLYVEDENRYCREMPAPHPLDLQVGQADHAAD